MTPRSRPLREPEPSADARPRREDLERRDALAERLRQELQARYPDEDGERRQHTKAMRTTGQKAEVEFEYEGWATVGRTKRHGRGTSARDRDEAWRRMLDSMLDALPMASKGLTEAWRSAEAAKPSDWTIRGVVLGQREVDPRIGGSRWAAWAAGPNGERVQAEAESRHDALNALALRLRELRGTPNG